MEKYVSIHQKYFSLLVICELPNQKPTCKMDVSLIKGETFLIIRHCKTKLFLIKTIKIFKGNKFPIIDVA